MTTLYQAALEWLDARSAYLKAARPTQEQQIRFVTSDGRLADAINAIGDWGEPNPFDEPGIDTVSLISSNPGDQTC